MGIDPTTLTTRFWEHADAGDRKQFGRRAETKEETQRKVVKFIEKTIHDQFSAFLNRHEIPFIHSPMNRKSSIAQGQPDYTILKPPWFMVEFKTPPNGLTTVQRDRIAFLEKQGNTVLVITEVLSSDGQPLGQALKEACAEVRKRYNLPEGFI